MSIEFESKKTIIELLSSSKSNILARLDLLEEFLFKETGKKLNKGCSSCINEAVLILKSIYNMSAFEFKRKAASYKNKKGDTTTISNSTMTDERAIEFLRTKPQRINLFSKYPANWKDLIEGKAETEEMKAKRIAIEAEIQAVEEAKEEGDENKEEPEKAIESDEDQLNSLSMKELRIKFPQVKATSKEEFIKKVLEK